MTRQTTASTPIDDMTVASRAPIIFRKSHKMAPPNSGKFFRHKNRDGGFFTPSTIRGLDALSVKTETASKNVRMADDSHLKRT